MKKGCVGKWDSRKQGKKILPLRAPTKDEFKAMPFKDKSYKKFLDANKLEGCDEANIIPPIFIMPST